MSQNKAFSTPFILAVLCIYFSYFLHGTDESPNDFGKNH